MPTADLLITAAATLDVFTGQMRHEPLAIRDGRVVGFGDYAARQTLALPGCVLLPGFCDGHIHLESSMLTPGQFAAAASAHGTTAVIADPHEIANVCGTAGIRYLLEASPAGLMDVHLMAPSCVPATPFETAGAELTAAEVAQLLQWEGILGLGEMMNFPGVLAGDPEVLAKLRVAADRPIDGHAPGLSGTDLMAYAAAGPESDHECTSLDELNEKLALGMWGMIREGSASRNLTALADALRGEARGRCLLVSDDLEAQDLLGRGHLDHLLREAVRLGVAPLDAVRAVTLNVAARFGLHRRGGLAPGYHADVVAVNNLSDFRVVATVKGGRLVARDAQLTVSPAEGRAGLTGTVHLEEVSTEQLALRAGGNGAEVEVIVASAGAIVTGRTRALLNVTGGTVQASPERDILKLAVVERHRRTGNTGLAFVQGFGLKTGALASTVAHDSHNLILAGCDDVSMRTAARAVIAAGGGQAVAAGERLLAVLPLPIAGLLSIESAASVAAANEQLEQAAGQLGCRLPRPFMALSFLALPVIPKLKLTDRGLFDVSRFTHISPLV